MSNYTKTTDFAAKDTLPTGDSGKIVRGSEFETEFDNIAIAVNSKSDSFNPVFTGEVKLGDTVRLQLGDDADLEIFSNGAGGTVENDTGNLTIKNRAVDGDIYFQSDDGTGVGTDTYFLLDGGEKKTKFLEDVLISGDLETTGEVTTANLTATGVVDFSGASSVLGGVPSGGTTGQILAKNSNTDYDVGFVDPADVATLAATNVTVADAGGYYTATDVEGVLQEIGAQPTGFDPNTDSFNIGSDAVSSGTDSIALGHDASSTGISGISLGPNTTASGNRSVSIGDSASATGNGSTAIGQNASVTSSYSTALGYGATVTATTAAIAINDATASGIGSMAIHDNALSSGLYSMAIGYWSQATGSSATAVGYSSEATAESSTALGHGAQATATDSIAIGRQLTTTGQEAIGIGHGAEASGGTSISIGADSWARYEGSIAVGKSANATGLGVPIAIGRDTASSGAYGISMGEGAVASGAQTLAIGYEAEANNDNGIAIGRQLTVSGQKAIGIGWAAVAGSYDSIGIGTNANAPNTYSISIGNMSKALASGGVAIGGGATIGVANAYGVAIGYAAQANDVGGIAIGNNAIVSSTSTFGTAIGRDSLADNGPYSTALGYGSSAYSYATALGSNTDATGNYSVAVGYGADSLGEDAIAIGYLAGADAENTIHINASGVNTNQPQTTGHIVIETDDASLTYNGTWSLAGGALSTDGLDVTGDVTFGDNDKAIFGAGNDLQIYHDGSHNFIEGANAGNIYIRNQLDDGDIIIQSDDGLGGMANYVQADGSNGEVRLFHYGSEKLNTTSTGIDVTGTAVADGLTVQTSQGDITIPTNTSSLNFARAGTNYIRATDASGSFNFVTGANDFATTRLRISANGDVALFEDTGTTAKFHWDASEERLGLGTSSPQGPLQVALSSARNLVVGFDTEGDSRTSLRSIESTANQLRPIQIEGQEIVFGTGAFDQTVSTERMRIDSSGKVGVGTSSFTSANSKLQVTGSGITTSDTTTALANKNARYFGVSQADQEVTMTYLAASATNNTLIVGGGTSLAEPASIVKFHTGAIGTKGAGEERLRITEDGKIGINTLAPKTALDISSGTGAALGPELTLTNGYAALTTGDRVGAINFYTSDASVHGANNSAIIEAQAASDFGHNANLIFKTGAPTSEGQDAVETMRLTSNGKAGIGESDPDEALVVRGGNYAANQDGGIALQLGDASESHYKAAFKLKTSSVGVPRTAIETSSGNSGGTKEAISIASSSGNVGINKENPSTALDIDGALMTSGTVYFHEATASTASAVEIGRNRTVDGSVFIDFSTAAAGSDNDFRIIRSAGLNGDVAFTNKGTGSMVFMTANTPAASITDGGDFLVGKTDTGFGTAGTEVQADGLVRITRDGASALQINRQTSDGSIVTFNKDNANVGSIGTNNDGGSKLFIGSSDSAVKFKTNAIVPCNNAGSNNNDDINLGENGTAFKDLYLSGGVFLGGTAAANKLDDYEEGTFTPTFTGSTTSDFTYGTQSGSYTKVGRLVFVTVNLTLSSKGTSAGSLSLTNLPFTVGDNLVGTSVEAAPNFNFWGGVTSAIYGLTGNATQSQATVTLNKIASAVTDLNTPLSVSDIDSDFQIRMSLVYQAA